MQHWRSVLPADRFLDIPYEALIGDQAGWSRRIIEFIGLNWDESCLNFHNTERAVGTASNWQVRQKIYHTSKARWRHYEKHLGPLLNMLDLDLQTDLNNQPPSFCTAPTPLNDHEKNQP